MNGKIRVGIEDDVRISIDPVTNVLYANYANECRPLTLKTGQRKNEEGKMEDASYIAVDTSTKIYLPT